jgi:hypothetical protein
MCTVYPKTLYRALAQRRRPRASRRADRGTPKVLPQGEMEYYCELISAIKVRRSNKKGLFEPIMFSVRYS